MNPSSLDKISTPPVRYGPLSAQTPILARRAPPSPKRQSESHFLLAAELPNPAPEEATLPRARERVTSPVAAAAAVTGRRGSGRHDGRPPLQQHLPRRPRRQRECASPAPVEFVRRDLIRRFVRVFRSTVRFRAGDFAGRARLAEFVLRYFVNGACFLF